MVKYFAGKITTALAEYHCIHDLQKEEYMYIITMLIEKWITMISIMLMAVCFRVIIPTLFFLFFLSAVKKRCGGFHANSFKSCFFLTIIIYITFILFLAPIMERELMATYILLGISIGILELIGAVNHPNINWNGEEYRESKKASRIAVMIEGAIIAFLVLLDADRKMIVFMAFAVILNALSLLIAKFRKQEGV